MKIIISRTDNLGDVALTLPLAGFLKAQQADTQIYFIGKSYTRPLIECSEAVSFFLDREDLLKNPDQLADIQADVILFVFPDKAIAQIAHKAKIPMRIGTSHRWWHWLFATHLVNFSRRNANLHEAQLNFKLLQPLGYKQVPTLSEIAELYHLIPPAIPENIQKHLPAHQKRIILHPKSKGSAREWGVEKYYQLALRNIDYLFFITGVAHEGEAIRAEKPSLFDLPNVIDLTGQMDLRSLIGFIAQTDALVASSTGTIHIAAALGINTVGIYPPMKPIHPTRWQPVGRQAHVLVLDKDCSDCRKTLPCHCMEAITVQEVERKLFF